MFCFVWQEISFFFSSCQLSKLSAVWRSEMFDVIDCLSKFLPFHPIYIPASRPSSQRGMNLTDVLKLTTISNLFKMPLLLFPPLLLINCSLLLHNKINEKVIDLTFKVEFLVDLSSTLFTLSK